MTAETLDSVVRTGFKLNDSCFYNGRLRQEYSELQKRFGPRVFNNSESTLDEIAIDSGVTEDELRTALLNHVCKTERSRKLEQLMEFHAGNFLYDVKSQLLDMLLGYYREAIGILDIDSYTWLLETVDIEQLDLDVQTINQEA